MKSKNETQQEFLTVSDAAKAANVTQATVKQWMYKGKITHHKQRKFDADGNPIGIRLYSMVNKSELQAIIAHRKQIKRATKAQLFEDSEGFLTIPQAAKLTNMDDISLRGWIYRGKLKQYTRRSIDEHGRPIGVKKIFVVKESDVLEILKNI